MKHLTNYYLTNYYFTNYYLTNYSYYKFWSGSAYKMYNHLFSELKVEKFSKHHTKVDSVESEQDNVLRNSHIATDHSP